nr:gypsy/Ty3 retroelement polyprotein [Tanacetum cinerariifolium]
MPDHKCSGQMFMLEISPDDVKQVEGSSECDIIVEAENDFEGHELLMSECCGKLEGREEDKVKIVSIHIYDRALASHLQFVRAQGDNMTWPMYEENYEQPFPLTMLGTRYTALEPQIDETVMNWVTSQKEIVEKRAKNLCFYCDQKYMPDHKCSGQMFMLEISPDDVEQVEGSSECDIIVEAENDFEGHELLMSECCRKLEGRLNSYRFLI